MTSKIVAAVAVLVFLILATANAGGYRYGVSDQAFHVPAFAQKIDPTLFPRDAALFAVQTSRTLGYDIFLPFVRSVEDLPTLFLSLYVIGLVGLAVSATALTRAMGASSWAAAGALALLTLRHRIARTGANSLEGYMNPRMLAFALGLGALAAVLRRRLAIAFALTAGAALIHPTTGLWFLAVAGAAAVTIWKARWAWLVAALGAIGATVWIVVSAERMDAAWLQVLEEKDYLFPLDWPVYAWLFNLAYPLVLWAIYRRRRTLGRLAPGEPALFAGLFVLVAGFAVSLPLTALNIAPAVQLQVNRVFWVLDAVTMVYVAWWLLDDFAARGGTRWRAVSLAMLVALSTARGVYVLAIETHRPLLQTTLPASDWNRALDWIRQQPKGWQVLAHPGHAARHGTSVRVGALHDTVVEQSKDSSTSMYDRPTAMRVAERSGALQALDTLNEEQLRALGQRFDAQVLVLERGRSLSLPVMYENSTFMVYDLRR